MCCGSLGAAVVANNDRVTFRADLTVRARKHTDKSGLLKMAVRRIPRKFITLRLPLDS
jgi:hypothetical protein